MNRSIATGLAGGFAIGLIVGGVIYIPLINRAEQTVEDSLNLVDEALLSAEKWEDAARDWKRMARQYYGQIAGEEIATRLFDPSQPEPPNMDPAIVEHNRRAVEHYTAEEGIISFADLTETTLSEPWDWSFTITNDLDTLVTIKADGTIAYGESYTPDAAAKIFWEHIGRGAPCAKP